MLNSAKLFALLAGLMMAVGLGACDKYTNSGETVGQKVDKAIDKTNEKVVVVSDKVGATVDKAGAAVSDAASSITDKATQTGDAISDTVITASIKADLLKDPDLDSLKIDVETRNGMVTLNGLAYSETARERAARIAIAVKGVQRVSNYLVLKKSS